MVPGHLDHVIERTMKRAVLIFFSLEFIKVVSGVVPPGGIEGLWITDFNLKDKVKDDAYLWMRTAVSRVQCALECTADARCMSHFYKESSATCIAQDVQLDSIDVRNSSGFLAYGLQTAAGCVAPFQYNRAANLCFWISDVKGNLTTAQQVCGSHGGSLATIDTVAKRNALLAYPNLDKDGLGNFVASYLIDGSDEMNEMDFRYKDGSVVPSGFWMSGFPRNNTAENCLHFPTWSNGLFMDYECGNSNYYFICQKP